MAKIRVHELAKELGITSKEALAKLQELGEFVRSASSTVEAPVVKKLQDAFPPEVVELAKKKKAAAKKPAEKKVSKSKKLVSDEVAEEVVVDTSELVEEKEEKSALKLSPSVVFSKPASSNKSNKPVSPVKKDKTVADVEQNEQVVVSENKVVSEDKVVSASVEVEPKVSVEEASPVVEKVFSAENQVVEAKTNLGGPKPAAPKPRVLAKGAPRPGNNPFASAQGMPRPGGSSRKPAADGGGRSDKRGSTNNSVKRSTDSGGSTRNHSNNTNKPANTGGSNPQRNSTSRNERSVGAASRRPGTNNFSSTPKEPATNSAAPAPAAPAGGGFGKGSRGRGGTQGAFGRGGSKSSKGRKSKRQKRQELDQMQAPSLGGVQVPRGDGSTVLRLRRGASLTDFAERIEANPASLVTVLFHLGEMATATQSLDEDIFTLLGVELGYSVEIVSLEDEDRELLDTFNIDLDKELSGEVKTQLEVRAPVVTVMGHVDHGKTRLLDAIRKSDVIISEAGGITQHIGAYQIHHEYEKVTRPITFLDTPGHEAFTAMRARGAKVTDIAILVVAADDGVMPQTVEALNHAQAAKVPIVVAVNKIDKDGANPDKIRQQLTEYGLVAEEYGGETMFVEVSARQFIGIDALIDAVLLTADAALDLRANPNKDARGTAIEANLDRGRGAVVTMLVQSGTLHVGDNVVAGTAHGRVRAMFDEHGLVVEEAHPSRAVQVLGLTSVPRAGDTFLVTKDERTARQIADKRETAQRNAVLAKRRKRISLEDFAAALEQGKIETLNLVLKGDVSGAVEALEDSLLKIDVGEEVQLRVIHRGVGAITQNDVNLATVDNAIIIGFNVKPAERVSDLAEREGVDIRYYSVIYSAIDDIELALKGMLKPEYEEVQVGSAQIREIFRSSKFGNIAGSLVRTGLIRRNGKARVLRNGKVVGENLVVETLKRFKDDATEVREGFECGIGLGSFNDLQVEDVIEIFEMREKSRV